MSSSAAAFELHLDFHGLRLTRVVDDPVFRRRKESVCLCQLLLVILGRGSPIAPFEVRLPTLYYGIRPQYLERKRSFGNLCCCASVHVPDALQDYGDLIGYDAVGCPQESLHLHEIQCATKRPLPFATCTTNVSVLVLFLVGLLRTPGNSEAFSKNFRMFWNGKCRLKISI